MECRGSAVGDYGSDGVCDEVSPLRRPRLQQVAYVCISSLSCVFCVSYNLSAVHISNSVGFRMERVRVRAIAYFALDTQEAAPEQLGGFHNRCTTTTHP
jgi:hypothetical protein